MEPDTKEPINPNNAYKINITVDKDPLFDGDNKPSNENPMVNKVINNN